MPRTHITPLGVLLIAASASCGTRSGGGMSDSAFVTVMASLRRLPAASLVDSTSRSRAREAILRSYAITAQQLEAKASALTRTPERAGLVWQAVERKQSEPRK